MGTDKYTLGLAKRAHGTDAYSMGTDKYTLGLARHPGKTLPTEQVKWHTLTIQSLTQAWEDMGQDLALLDALMKKSVTPINNHLITLRKDPEKNAIINTITKGTLNAKKWDELTGQTRSKK